MIRILPGRPRLVPILLAALLLPAGMAATPLPPAAPPPTPLPPAPAPEDPAPVERALDRRAATRAVDIVRHAMPVGWENRSVRWDTVPTGWRGEPECVRIEVAPGWIDPDDGDAYVIWLLPPCWEGRMEVATLGRTPRAVYLGENSSFRVLHETIGVSRWESAPNVLGDRLALTTYPLTGRPEHTLDVGAMQRLYAQLDSTSERSLDRWLKRIYGIEELDRVVYVELLTWDERQDDAEDPTWLGDIAERETRFLSREALAAFPEKQGLYLRRVTRDSFSDVIVVNASRPGS